LRKHNILFLLIIVTAISCTENNQTRFTELNGRTQGTTYSIKIVDLNLSSNSSLKENLHKEIDSILVEISNQMSTWQNDSEISEFNKSQTTDWFPVSLDFVNVVETSQRISETSNGALDITVGALVNLWGFGPGGKDEVIPSDQEIEEAKNLCDYKKISFKKDGPAIKKEIGEITIDLSAVAQGFSVDKIFDYLSALNYKNFLVEIGGEVRTAGKNYVDENWKIGISVPDGSFDIQKVINLDNAAVSTSGDYRDYFEKDGVRFSHTIDPQTGKPITHSLASVTVVCNNCADADGFSTAIDVLGPEAGYELAVKEKLAVLMIVKSGNGFTEKMTPEFASLFKK